MRRRIKKNCKFRIVNQKPDFAVTDVVIPSRGKGDRPRFHQEERYCTVLPNGEVPFDLKRPHLNRESRSLLPKEAQILNSRENVVQLLVENVISPINRELSIEERNNVNHRQLVSIFCPSRHKEPCLRDLETSDHGKITLNATIGQELKLVSRLRHVVVEKTDFERTVEEGLLRNNHPVKFT